MSNPFDQFKGVLDDLERSLEKNKVLWNSLRGLNPDFEQLSDQHWIEKHNRSWLHGADLIPNLGPLGRRPQSPPLQRSIACFRRIRKPPRGHAAEPKQNREAEKYILFSYFPR